MKRSSFRKSDLKSQICPNCGFKGLSFFYEVRDVPVQSSSVMPTRSEALKSPKGDILLGFCRECGFITNAAYDSSMVDYALSYEDQQCFSPTFDGFAKNLAGHLIEKYDLHGKGILEIGCGKGDFLMLLCELGGNRGVGIDPAIAEDRIRNKSSDRLTFIKDYYSERHANYHADLICCRHTLEHIHDTAHFLSTVRKAIGNRMDTVVFFEVPDTTRILHEIAFWDIYYEHCSYFSPGSIARLFRSCKFEVVALSKAFDDQYLLVEARPTSETSGKVHESEESLDELAKDVKHFATQCQDELDWWKSCLRQIDAERKRAVVWGSGSKCVSFLTTLGIGDKFEYVIDVNPYRHGKFLPGVGKKIMPPEFLKKYKPEITVVMNPIYCSEIQKMLASMGVATELMPLSARPRSIRKSLENRNA
jgi:SAM-dependent methyltransferase